MMLDGYNLTTTSTPIIEDESFDKKQYEAYIEKYGKENCMSLDNWRMQNVNTLICKVYRTIKSVDCQLSSAYHRKAI